MDGHRKLAHACSFTRCERGKLWVEEFLKRCGISKSYYDKHRSDVCSGGTTEENREYRKSVDRAIENARKLRTSP